MKTVYEDARACLLRLEAIQVRILSALDRDDLDDVQAGLRARDRELAGLAAAFESLPTERSERASVDRLIQRLGALYDTGQELHARVEARSRAVLDALREVRDTERVLAHSPVAGRRSGMWCDVRR